MRGRFISFEGLDGTGKTTQIQLLSAYLTARGVDHLCTREPGGTQEAEAVRSLLLQNEGRRWQPITELLLLLAARVEHVVQVIQPALDAGKWVLCDRFIDSSIAYQGYGAQLGADLVQQMHTLIVGALMPDVTFVLGLSFEESLKRKHLSTEPGFEDHFEKKGNEFYQRVERGYRYVLENFAQRCVRVDSSQTVESVAAAIQGVLADRFEG